jgi:hypothetical protein
VPIPSAKLSVQVTSTLPPTFDRCAWIVASEPYARVNVREEALGKHLEAHHDAPRPQKLFRKRHTTRGCCKVQEINTRTCILLRVGHSHLDIHQAAMELVRRTCRAHWMILECGQSQGSGTRGLSASYHEKHSVGAEGVRTADPDL